MWLKQSSEADEAVKSSRGSASASIRSSMRQRPDLKGFVEEQWSKSKA